MASPADRSTRGRRLPRLAYFLVALVTLVVFFPFDGVMTVRGLPKTKQTRATADLANLAAALRMFNTDTAVYPESLEALITNGSGNPRWDGPYAMNGVIPRDPWGRPYVYQLRAEGYSLLCYGADGAEGGTGEDSDIYSPHISPARK